MNDELNPLEALHAARALRETPGIERLDVSVEDWSSRAWRPAGSRSLTDRWLKTGEPLVPPMLKRVRR